MSVNKSNPLGQTFDTSLASIVGKKSAKEEFGVEAEERTELDISTLAQGVINTVGDVMNGKKGKNALGALALKIENVNDDKEVRQKIFTPLAEITKSQFKQRIEELYAGKKGKGFTGVIKKILAERWGIGLDRADEQLYKAMDKFRHKEKELQGRIKNKEKELQKQQKKESQTQTELEKDKNSSTSTQTTSQQVHERQVRDRNTDSPRYGDSIRAVARKIVKKGERTADKAGELTSDTQNLLERARSLNQETPEILASRDAFDRQQVEADKAAEKRLEALRVVNKERQKDRLSFDPSKAATTSNVGKPTTKDTYRENLKKLQKQSGTNTTNPYPH